MMCERCKKDVPPVYSQAGPHIKADCPICKRYIKFIPLTRKEDWVMPFGKYKGVKLAEVTDFEYLEWLLQKVEMGKRMRTLIEERVNEKE